MSDIQVGDEAWNWGGGQPTGVAKEEATTAVYVEREGNDVVKRASELERLSGGGEQDNAQTSGEAAGQEGEESEEPKKTTRSGRRGGRKATAETRKKQSEAGKKGGAATAAKKAGGRKREKAAPEDAAVGEKREREGVVEEKGRKQGEDINMEKGEKEWIQVTGVTTEQEKAEKEAGKEAKKAKISPEGSDEYVPGEEPEGVEEDAAHEEARPVEPEVAGISEESKDLERDNRKLSAAGTEPRRAAETASESIATAGEEGPSPTGEKKRGGRKGTTRGKAAA